MARCSITLLGSMQVNLDGRPLHALESGKVRCLLAYLAVESEQAHERERLAGLFWPEMSEAQARHNLSQSLHNLRQALGEEDKAGSLSAQPGSAASYLLVTPHTVQFNPHSEAWLDVCEFDIRIAAVRQHAHRRLETCGQCARLLQEAERLYQGDFLAGVSLRGCQAFEEWALVWRERLRRQLCEAFADLVTYYEGRDELRRASALTERWVQVDPLNETAQRRLMRLLALDGQRTQALARYAGFSRILATELGVEPSRESQQLYQRILAEESAQTNLPGLPGRLPVPLTPFVGREDELAELIAWLRVAQTRLVTLLGPGGCGKTRLALQAARSLRYDFPDGIFLVSLSGIGSSEAFLPALASALNLVFQPGWGDPFEQLYAYLQRRHLLLILDSFEEVSPASQQLTRLLQAAPGLQLLVTSRARLNVQAEQVFPLEGLRYPVSCDLGREELNIADYSALQLFQNAARQVRPDITLTSTDLPTLARICRLVDGMPLGLVLAAGWLATSTPDEIADEIETSLDFLSSSWGDLPERQRSLRATLDHSWRLLSATERQAFQKLSVFQGVFNRQAAEQVAGINMTGLRGLVDKSMLQASPGSYRMHDLLRQYAVEKLSTDEPAASQVRQAHCAFYLERLAEREGYLKSARRSETLNELDAEINDLQSAWKWACTQADIARLARSLEGLCLYYEMRLRFREGAAACQAALSHLPLHPDQPGEAQVLRTRLLLWQARFLVSSCRLEAAVPLHREAGEMLDRLEKQGLDVRRPRAMYWQAEGDAKAELKVKLECSQRGIALYQELGDAWQQVNMLVWAVELSHRLGDPGLVLQSQQEALRLARQLGEPHIILYSLRQLAYFNFLTNQFENARQLMQETAAFLESVAEVPLRAETQMHLGVLLIWSAHFTDGILALESAIPQLRSLGFRNGVHFGSVALGIGLVLNGEYQRSEAVLTPLIPEAEQGGSPREAAVGLLALGMAALAERRLDPALAYLQESVSRYRQMQFAGELGWALGGLSLVQDATGQPEAAQVSLIEALNIASKTHSMFAMVSCLAAMVSFLARRGHLEAALRVHRLALMQPVHQSSLWYAQIIGDEMVQQWDALPAVQQEAIDTSVKSLTPFSIIPEVLVLLEQSG